jgi:hypothetical protein
MKGNSLGLLGRVARAGAVSSFVAMGADRGVELGNPDGWRRGEVLRITVGPDKCCDKAPRVRNDPTPPD